MVLEIQNFVDDKLVNRFGQKIINKIDVIQLSSEKFITSLSTGDAFRFTMDLIPKEKNTYWPYSTKRWYWNCAVANVFWAIGELLGDLYPLMRTYAVTNNKKKLKVVYITYGIYNIFRILNAYTYFMKIPMDLSTKKDDYLKFKLYWWGTITAMQISSLLYDISIILCLRKNLFNKLKELPNNKYEIEKKISPNNFMERFKRVSEFRIIVSMICTMIFLPFLIGTIILLFYRYANVNLRRYNADAVSNSESDLSYILNSKFSNIETTVEQFRQVVISVNFTFMYIDQILLKCYVERSQPKYFNISGISEITGSSSNTKFNTPTTNINLTYLNSTFTTSPPLSPTIDTICNEPVTGKIPNNSTYSESTNLIKENSTKSTITTNTINIFDDYNYDYNSQNNIFNYNNFKNDLNNRESNSNNITEIDCYSNTTNYYNVRKNNDSYYSSGRKNSDSYHNVRKNSEGYYSSGRKNSDSYHNVRKNSEGYYSSGRKNSDSYHNVRKNSEGYYSSGRKNSDSYHNVRKNIEGYYNNNNRKNSDPYYNKVRKASENYYTRY
ncbi:hypothetical protein BCR36DRAFT_405323 [Piromyces finnis]|uniref:Uncharacterized protein n=1 Tax=Piromyces finnis TaxID=1754191 RepID=A0A1Y1V5C8_9FUNG|nr:hypothetical protein BCR36DRAFT_405323 [Piromyces finnis]|eukprot:ORX47643.1 hypothetical protein BCR36DRAFT_405323 [Piromyces finnis]